MGIGLCTINFAKRQQRLLSFMATKWNIFVCLMQLWKSWAMTSEELGG
jgi:hypothetical protein